MEDDLSFSEEITEEKTFTPKEKAFKREDINDIEHKENKVEDYLKIYIHKKILGIEEESSIIIL